MIEVFSAIATSPDGKQTAILIRLCPDAGSAEQFLLQNMARYDTYAGWVVQAYAIQGVPVGSPVEIPKIVKIEQPKKRWWQRLGI
jgi:hypothetical protein